jgi:hypothetical protein
VGPRSAKDTTNSLRRFDIPSNRYRCSLSE